MLVKKGCATVPASSFFSTAEFSHEAGSAGIPSALVALLFPTEW